MSKIDFTQLEFEFRGKIKVIFSERLLFYCVTGSTARNQNVNRWSDIDIVLCIKDLKVDDLISIGVVVDSYVSIVKIGTTTYSDLDIKSYENFDPKTLNMYRNIVDGRYVPVVDSVNIKSLKITKNVIDNSNAVEYAKDWHVYKRELLKGDLLFDERKAYKTLTYLIRSIFLRKGYNIDGYYETWSMVKDKCGVGYVLYPEEILNLPDEKVLRFPFYIKWFEKLNKDNSLN